MYLYLVQDADKRKGQSPSSWAKALAIPPERELALKSAEKKLVEIRDIWRAELKVHMNKSKKSNNNQKTFVISANNLNLPDGMDLNQLIQNLMPQDLLGQIQDFANGAANNEL